MKKYILAGAIGFLVHATVIIGTGALLSSNSPFDVAGFYIKTMEKSIPVAFWYAFLISIVFALIFRVLFVRAGHGAKEKWFLSFTAGAGFHLAFWALVGLLWAMFSGFGF